MASSKQTPALEIDSLSKWYGRSRGVEDLSFSIESGEIFGYLGPNGSGKTTTLRCILGLIKASAGAMRIFGSPVRYGLAVQHGRIGYLPGDFRIWPGLTAEKALRCLGSLGAKNHGWRRGMELAERLGLDPKRRIRDLSKGNRQKVGIVFAFQHKPDLLILDEPTSGLDPLIRRIVLDLVREAAARGATVLLSSHDLPEVAATCGRAAILRNGRLVELAPLHELIRQSHFEIKVWFLRNAPDFPEGQLRDASVLEKKANYMHISYQGSPDGILQWLAGHHVERISMPEQTLEEAFMVYYRDHEPSVAGGKCDADAEQ